MARRTPRVARKPSSDPPPARREEVLETALSLIAERGVAGASLRALAGELGMSQPSLYHYFSSKDDLVAQIVEYGTHKMLDVKPVERPLTRLEELPRFVCDTVFALYSTERHPRFVRFMFAVAGESEEYRTAMRRAFEERLYPGFTVVARAFAANAEERREIEGVTKMIVYALGLACLERRALLQMPLDDPAIVAQAEWLVCAGEALLEQRVLAPRRARQQRA